MAEVYSSRQIKYHPIKKSIRWGKVFFFLYLRNNNRIEKKIRDKISGETKEIKSRRKVWEESWREEKVLTMRFFFQRKISKKEKSKEELFFGKKISMTKPPETCKKIENFVFRGFGARLSWIWGPWAEIFWG